MTNVAVGSTVIIDALKNGMQRDGALLWMSSDSSKATVNSSREVRGISLGEVIITGTSTEDSSKQAIVCVNIISISTPTLLNIAPQATVSTDIGYWMGVPW